MRKDDEKDDKQAAGRWKARRDGTPASAHAGGDDARRSRARRPHPAGYRREEGASMRKDDKRYSRKLYKKKNDKGDVARTMR